MASKQLSPAAQLLRHSKLFSIPAQTRQPTVEGNGTLAHNHSKTATKHFPTHAAIITTHKGGQRGDWGLKRSLPRRKTSARANPIVQIKDVDNIDHYTDYEAATPHAIALRKFQEMNIPIMKPEFSGRIMTSLIPDGSRSVFDVYEPAQPRRHLPQAADGTSTASSTGLSASKADGASKQVERWKFNGPWLAGMDEVRFDQYLEKAVRPRRQQFKQFLWNWMQKTKAARLNSQQLATGEISTERKPDLTEEEYETWLVKLRHEGQQLYALVWEFLDLPGRPPSERDDQSIGPPATHPSGGLSYLKTDSMLQNHPVLGPMREHQPVIARVLQRPQVATGRQNERGEAVGIGGFVSSIRTQRGLFATEKNAPQMYGDKKVHVVPRSAKIDERGRVNIDYTIATKDSVALWETEYDAEEEAKANREDEKIKGFAQKPVSLSELFSSTRRTAV